MNTVIEPKDLSRSEDCSLFGSYSPEEVQQNLWQLYRGWAYHSAHADRKIMMDMLQFYERLNDLVMRRHPGIEPKVPACTIAQQKKDRVKQNKLQSMIDFIVETVPVEKIFMLEHKLEETENKKILDLLVVVSRTNGTQFAELEPLIEFAALGHPHVSVSLHTSGQMELSLKNGHIYYSAVCKAENIVYDDHSRSLPQVPVERFTEIRDQARKDFYLNHNRGVSYYDSAHQNYALGRRDTALFLAHQAMELCFRGILWALLSQDKRTHSIRVLKKFTRRIAPQLAAIFPDETNKDERFLQFLEDVYLDARYKHDLLIDEDVLLTILAKAGKVVEVSKRVFEEWTSRLGLPAHEAGSECVKMP